MVRRQHLDTAFTLTELLVVISIIAVLCSILVPTINLARQKAGGARCGSLMRQCALAHISYAKDNRGRLPYTVVTDPAGKHHYWFNVITDFTDLVDTGSNGLATQTGSNKTNKTIQCPNIPAEYLMNGIGYNTTGLARNYRLRGPGSTERRYWDGGRTMNDPNVTPGNPNFSASYYTQFSLAQVTLVSQRILLGHTDCGPGIDGDPTDDAIYPETFGGPTTATGDYGNSRPSFQAMMTIHGSSMPYAFIDGHVANLTQKSAACGFYNPAKMP